MRGNAEAHTCPNCGKQLDPPWHQFSGEAASQPATAPTTTIEVLAIGKRDLFTIVMLAAAVAVFVLVAGELLGGFIASLGRKTVG